MNMLNLAMEYADLSKECAEVLTLAAKLHSEQDYENECKCSLKYRELCRKTRELEDDLSHIPVPDEIAQKRPIASLSHDEIAKSLGGKVPGCGCLKCRG